MFKGLHLLEDTEDIGDEYDYSPCKASKTLTSEDYAGSLKILNNGSLYGRIEACFSFSLPKSLEKDRTKRSRTFVECPVAVRIGLRAHDPIIEIETVFENRVEDHRLRAMCPAGIVALEVVSDGHFYVNRRPIAGAGGDNWTQPPTGTHPQQDYSVIQEDGTGLAVLNKGLPEIEVSKDDAGHACLHLTLLRSVGWLSRDDFPTRRFSNAGPTLHTPEAQCPGPHAFRYALVPFSGDDVSADIKGISRRYKVPVPVIQGVEDLHVPGGNDFLRKENHLVSTTSIKRSETTGNMIARFYNLSDQAVEEMLTFGRRIQKAWRVNLLEEREGELDVLDECRLALTLQPHEILTVEAEFP